MGTTRGEKARKRMMMAALQEIIENKKEKSAIRIQAVQTLMKLTEEKAEKQTSGMDDSISRLLGF